MCAVHIMAPYNCMSCHSRTQQRHDGFQARHISAFLQHFPCWVQFSKMLPFFSLVRFVLTGSSVWSVTGGISAEMSLALMPCLFKKGDLTFVRKEVLFFVLHAVMHPPWDSIPSRLKASYYPRHILQGRQTFLRSRVQIVYTFRRSSFACQWEFWRAK